MTHDCKRHGPTTLFAALELNRYYAMVVTCRLCRGRSRAPRSWAWG